VPWVATEVVLGETAGKGVAQAALVVRVAEPADMGAPGAVATVVAP